MAIGCYSNYHRYFQYEAYKANWQQLVSVLIYVLTLLNGAHQGISLLYNLVFLPPARWNFLGGLPDHWPKHI